MTPLPLHEAHLSLGARFTEVNGSEVVSDYGDVSAEHAALRSAVGVMDLSFRGRLCLTGADRVRFLNGQVSNNVKDLRAGDGCYAALVTAKARLESDLNIFALPDELLMDFEPGLAPRISQRLERFIIADDVQISDVAAPYGLLSVQGPKSGATVAALGLTVTLPERPLSFATIRDPTLGELYLVNHPRLGAAGFDLFVPAPALAAVLDKLITAARQSGGRPCGFQAWEIARIEAGTPRFGVDMDESNLAPEAGITGRAISYTKGCYIGQEVISRIRTYGEVAKSLRGLRLADDLPALPTKGDKLFHNGKEVGYITSAIRSPVLEANIALGYVRKEVNEPGAGLTLRIGATESRATIAALPFVPPVR
jgi:folate-binding protein YgfZ